MDNKIVTEIHDKLIKILKPAVMNVVLEIINRHLKINKFVDDKILHSEDTILFDSKIIRKPKHNNGITGVPPKQSSINTKKIIKSYIEERKSAILLMSRQDRGYRAETLAKKLNISTEKLHNIIKEHTTLKNGVYRLNLRGRFLLEVYKNARTGRPAKTV